MRRHDHLPPRTAPKLVVSSENKKHNRNQNSVKIHGINDIIIDPGFGFSKTTQQNYELLNNLEFFKEFQRPIIIGISRKSMIYKTLNTTPDKALNGSSVLHTISLMKGANILRTHDVKEAVECVKIVSQLIG